MAASPTGPAVCQGKDSMAADHAVLVSRIKPHTDFRSHLESGPSKMCVIGWGKQHGASMMHSGGGRNFQIYLEPGARVYETNTNFPRRHLPGRNAFEDTALIAGLTAAEVGTKKEAELLVKAKEYLAQIPFAAVDVLVVRDLGKNISGTGMDTNVISRLSIPRQPENFGKVDVAIITVLDLTEETHGNVSGLGLANVTTARVFRKIDWQATYMNAVTSGIFSATRSHLPLTFADDQRALEVALRICAEPQDEARMVFIRDTLSLEDFYVSPACGQRSKHILASPSPAPRRSPSCTASCRPRGNWSRRWSTHEIRGGHLPSRPSAWRPPAGSGPRSRRACWHRKPDRTEYRPSSMARGIVVIGDPWLLDWGAQCADVSLDLPCYSSPEQLPSSSNGPLLLSGPSFPPDAHTPGLVSAAAGRYVLQTLDYAAALARAGAIDGICYASLNKQAMHAAGSRHEDELRYFADRLDVSGYVGEVNTLDDLWTSRVSSHFPLRAACDRISVDEILPAIRLIHQTIRQSGVPSPRIAVAV